MDYGFIAPELHGHLNPMTVLGGELARRGHRVTLLGSSLVRPFAERAGLDWWSVDDTDRAMERWKRLGELSGLAAMRYTGAVLKDTTASLRERVPAAIRDKGIDALVVDQISPAGALVAEEHGLPYVVACNALAIHVTDAVPPPPLNWKHRTGVLGRLRNRCGVWVCRTLFDRFSGAHEPGGVSLLMLADLQKKRGAAMVAQQPACFDFPDSPRPDHFHYTAPWHLPGRDDDVPFPWDRLDGRPLVYASMGTLQNKLRYVYAAIGEAARGLDLQMVLALGDPDATLARAVPENVIVVGFAPQLALLDRAAAVITHAGLNTTLEALARGLPLLCLPVTNDQPGIARRVEYLGAGEVLSIKRAQPPRIRQAVLRLLSEPRFRESARRLRDQFRDVNGPAMAADIIERSTTGVADGQQPPLQRRAIESFKSGGHG